METVKSSHQTKILAKAESLMPMMKAASPIVLWRRKMRFQMGRLVMVRGSPWEGEVMTRRGR